MGLSVRQAKFVAAYLRLRDGQAAALEAGYGAKSAKTQASRNLRIPEIREALRRANASVVENVNHVNHLQENVNRDIIKNGEITAARTIRETASLAYYDHPDIPPETRYANKVPALRLLSGQLGMIHSPGPAPMLGPIFSINIHTSPRGAEECRRDHGPIASSNDQAASSADSQVVEEPFDDGQTITLVPERKP